MTKDEFWERCEPGELRTVILDHSNWTGLIKETHSGWEHYSFFISMISSVGEVSDKVTLVYYLHVREVI